mgnify:CR=1 FL=1
MKKNNISEELDLFEIFFTIWKNKTKVIFITIVTIVIFLSFNLINKKGFLASSEIIPISIFEANKYLPFNTYNTIVNQNNLQNNSKDKKDSELNSIYTINNIIDKDYLLNLFIEKLKDREIIIEAIIKFKLIDEKDFANNKLFLAAVKKLALDLEILPPNNESIKKCIKDCNRLNWIIKFKTYNKDNWFDALEYINEKINAEIKIALINQLNFEKKITNQIVSFKLEDIENKINNVKKKYEILTQNRLAFLKEQSLIARELNILNNSLETQEYNASSTIISNIQTETPYYMKGYKMIEKEISLIESRSNKNAFIPDLYKLEIQKRKLSEDKNIERFELLFSNTPIMKSEKFEAAKINFENTKFIASRNLKTLLTIAIIIGLIIGVFYILFEKHKAK